MALMVAALANVKEVANVLTANVIVNNDFQFVYRFEMEINI